MSRYIVTRHSGVEGVRLSLPGSWGNLPFPTVEAAVAYARSESGDRVPIEVQPIRRLRS